MTNSVDVPDLVRRRALAHGEVGARWLRDLPAIVESLGQRWEVAIGSTLTGGTAAYVAEATSSDGVAVVVKVAMPPEIDGPDAFERAVQTFALADGRGCARLLAHDVDLGAMLLERLGRNLDQLGLPVARQLEIICGTVQLMWRPVPAETHLPTGAEKARWLADSITLAWETLDRPCATTTIDLALTFATRREAAFDPSTAVLVHGDAHSWNTLEAGSGAFKLVDPEGLISEPAHDLAVPMRELNQELLDGDALRLGQARASLLGRLCGVDAVAIWEWGLVERVSTGLYSMTLGHEGAADFLTVADRWAAP
ncbi:MAG: aminoglycoside phosphotransferase family protein [Acidimicrobiales bacterium]